MKTESRVAGDWRVWQNPSVADEFARRRRGGVLGAAEQMSVLLRLLGALPSTPRHVLDLGCGDGVLLEAIRTAFPKVHGVALDGSPAMLRQATQRLNADTTVFVAADFNDPAWQEALPASPREFDAVVSGFAIHHSEDDRKRELYAEIFDLLRPGGVFVNIEHVASASPLGEKLFEAAFAENLAEFRRANGEKISDAQVAKELSARLDKSANRLTPVETQLSWLREIGFNQVDCYWKQFELAVLAGFKPGTLGGQKG